MDWSEVGFERISTAFSICAIEYDVSNLTGYAERWLELRQLGAR